MDASWRPKTVDPLGKAMGMPPQQERGYELWLDLRTAEVTFAQQALVQLFYAVRRVVDEAGRALPKGAKVEVRARARVALTLTLTLAHSPCPPAQGSPHRRDDLRG